MAANAHTLHLLTLLPAELTTHILGYTDGRTAVAFEHLGALRALLSAHRRAGNHSRRLGRELTAASVRQGWSAGVEELVRHGFYDVLDMDPHAVRIGDDEVLCALYDYKMRAYTPADVVALDTMRPLATLAFDRLLLLVAESLIGKQGEQGKQGENNKQGAAAEQGEPQRAAATTMARTQHPVLALALAEQALQRRCAVAVVLRVCKVTGLPTDSADLWQCAAHLGRLDMLVWMSGQHPTLMLHHSKRALMEAAAGGHLPAVQYVVCAVKQGGSGNCDSAMGMALQAAVARGHVHVASWLHGTSAHYVESSTVREAAAHGHLRALQWLHERGIGKFTEEVMDAAAAGGYLEVVDWLLQHRTEGCTVQAVNGAAAGGHLPVLRRLLQHGVGGTAQATERAAASGHQSTVRWLHSFMPSTRSARALNCALEGGHLALAQWLHTHSASSSLATVNTTTIARRDTLDVLAWLHEHTAVRCRGWTMRAAVTTGNLDLVQWLDRAVDIAYTLDMLEGAVDSGNLAIVQWVYARLDPRCAPQMPRVLALAARYNRLDMVRWLCQASGIPEPPAKQHQPASGKEAWSGIDSHPRSLIDGHAPLRRPAGLTRL
ncbi:hypothetical protein RI367_003492 [Sorochytrium milnesiophthora]